VISLERGFIKSDGRAIPYENPRDYSVQATPVDAVFVDYFDRPVTRLTRANDLRVVEETPTTHLLVLRDGRMIQLNNLFVRNGSSAIRISLTNTGPLRLATNPRGERVIMRGQGGVEARMEDVVSIGSPPRQHQRVSVEQIETLHALIYGLCFLAEGSPSVAYDPYVSATLSAQAIPLPTALCPTRSETGRVGAANSEPSVVAPAGV